MSITQCEAKQFLMALGRALSVGDVERVAAARHLPALMAGVRGSLTAAGARQVRSSFRRSIADYHALGIVFASSRDDR